jgi:hypothetical protein
MPLKHDVTTDAHVGAHAGKLLVLNSSWTPVSAAKTTDLLSAVPVASARGLAEAAVCCFDCCGVGECRSAVSTVLAGVRRALLSMTKRAASFCFHCKGNAVRDGLCDDKWLAVGADRCIHEN